MTRKVKHKQYVTITKVSPKGCLDIFMMFLVFSIPIVGPWVVIGVFNRMNQDEDGHNIWEEKVRLKVENGEVKDDE